VEKAKRPALNPPSAALFIRNLKEIEKTQISTYMVEFLHKFFKIARGFCGSNYHSEHSQFLRTWGEYYCWCLPISLYCGGSCPTSWFDWTVFFLICHVFSFSTCSEGTRLPCTTMWFKLFFLPYCSCGVPKKRRLSPLLVA
jgi:hypothetical protein